MLPRIDEWTNEFETAETDGGRDSEINRKKLTMANTMGIRITETIEQDKYHLPTKDNC